MTSIVAGNSVELLDNVNHRRDVENRLEGGCDDSWFFGSVAIFPLLPLNVHDSSGTPGSRRCRFVLSFLVDIMRFPLVRNVASEQSNLRRPVITLGHRNFGAGKRGQDIQTG